MKRKGPSVRTSRNADNQVETAAYRQIRGRPDRRCWPNRDCRSTGCESTNASHRLVRKADVPDQARLLCVASIRLVGWQYSEPSKCGLQIVEGLDNHATVRRRFRRISAYRAPVRREHSQCVERDSVRDLQTRRTSVLRIRHTGTVQGSGSPPSARPSKSTFPILCRATASSITKKVLLASANENSPRASTFRKPDSGHTFSFMLILTRASPASFINTHVQFPEGTDFRV